jgi:hypothetical protein
MKLYVIDEGQLQMLKHIAKRLFTEERMNGDDMRTYAQALSGTVKICEEIPIPNDTKLLREDIRMSDELLSEIRSDLKGNSNV